MNKIKSCKIEPNFKNICNRFLGLIEAHVIFRFIIELLNVLIKFKSIYYFFFNFSVPVMNRETKLFMVKIKKAFV